MLRFWKELTKTIFVSIVAMFLACFRLQRDFSQSARAHSTADRAWQKRKQNLYYIHEKATLCHVVVFAFIVWCREKKRDARAHVCVWMRKRRRGIRGFFPPFPKASNSHKRDSDEKSYCHLLSSSRITQYIGGKSGLYNASETFSTKTWHTYSSLVYSRASNFIW